MFTTLNETTFIQLFYFNTDVLTYIPSAGPDAEADHLLYWGHRAMAQVRLASQEREEARWCMTLVVWRGSFSWKRRGFLRGQRVEHLLTHCFGVGTMISQFHGKSRVHLSNLDYGQCCPQPP